MLSENLLEKSAPRTGPLLTIAIPTYNRPAELRRCLEPLLPQLNDACVLYISDNYSPTPAAEVALPIIERHGFAHFSISRRPFNIGGAGNIMHCYEKADTPWVWVLGDDDIPLPDAIARILALIEAHPDTLGFGFEYERAFDPIPEGTPKTTVIQSASEFLSSRALLSVSLISSCVYNVSAIHGVFYDGYNFSSSFYPHLAWLLRCIQVNPTIPIRYSLDPIITFLADGFIEAPVATLFPNIRYLTRMLQSNADRPALMQSSFAKYLIGPPAKRLSRPGFLAIVAAAAFRHLEASRKLLARARRVAGECLEFDEAGRLMPLTGGYASVRLLVAIGLGWFLGPVIRPLYRLKVRGRRDCPTLVSGFDSFIVF